jgi:hypothetical protein
MVQKQSQMAGCAYKYWNDKPAMNSFYWEQHPVKTPAGILVLLYDRVHPAETSATKLEVPQAAARGLLKCGRPTRIITMGFIKCGVHPVAAKSPVLFKHRAS